MNTYADWWTNVDGGVYCSNCGALHDDFWKPAPPRCEKCFSIMSDDNYVLIDREYRMSIAGTGYYISKNEYPDWLLELRNKFEGT